MPPVIFKSLLLFVGFGLCLISPTVAQSLPSASEPSPAFMHQMVAFVGDFIYRLNYQRTPDNEPMDSTNRLRYTRGPYLRELFDERDPRFNRRSGQFVPAYALAAEAFVTDVVQDTAQVYLPDAHEQLFAEVTYGFRHYDRLVPVRVYLKRYRQGQAYDWRILDVAHSLTEPLLVVPTLPDTNSIPLLTLPETLMNLPDPTDSLPPRPAPADERTQLFITSQTHETRFLNLYKHLHDRRDLLRLTIQPPSNALQTLARLLETSAVTVDHTESIHLYLNTHRGWVLRLDNLNRESANSGWLITDLYGPNAPCRPPAAIDTYLRQHP